MHVKFGSEGQRLPLTASQHGMWLYQQLDPASPSGCAAEFVEITGPLDEELLEEALRRAVQDTEALRVRFEECDRGQVRQVLRDDPPSSLERHDLREAPSPAHAAQVWMRSRLFRPIDLRRGVSLSVALLRTEDERRLLYIGVHHIALDGYGFSLFIQRLAEIYTALEQGRSVASAPWPTLAELIADEDAYRRSPRWQEDLSYWSEQLRTRDPVPGTAARLKPLTNLPHRETGHIAPAAAEALRLLARQARTSLPAVAMAALALYVHRLTGRAQVSLDLTVTSRTGKICRAVPSMLANVLPLAVRCQGELTVRDLMRETAHQARDLLRHQRFPAGHLVRDLGATKPGGFLGDWGINIMGYDEPLAFGRCPATLHNLSNGPCDGLAVNVYERSADGTLRIDFNAGTDTYPPAEVRAHHERFLALLETLAAADPELPVGSLDVLTRDDRVRLSAVHGPTPEVPAHLLPELVQERARRTPEARAVVDRVTSLTYRELNSRANRLARLLVAHGAGPERHVALALSRTAAYPLAVLAVLKAGAACVPLDPGHPAERIRHVLAETRPVCVVTDTAALDGLFDCPTVRIGADRAAEPSRPEAEAEGFGDHDLTDGDRLSPLLPRHPAYVSYTSGSSGRPKGVVVEHRSLTHLYDDHERELIAPAARAAGRPLRAALTAAFTFDTSWEGMLFLAAGQEVHVIDDGLRKDPDALTAYVAGHGIDFLDVTPSYLHQLIACGLLADGRSRPRLLMVGGEPLDAELWRTLRARPETVSYNYYGPTECTVDAVYCRLDEQGDVPVLGRPGHHVRAYVLDEALRMLPPGTPGELYLAGPQVARGYLGHPELTEERFLPDPFDESGGRLYRTGDLVRWTRDDTLEFLGRTDHQLSLWGNRIEPGEIENVLTAHPCVGQAAVTVAHPAAGAPALVAFVVSRTAQVPDDLRTWAAGRLPDQLVPARYLALDSLPFTSHGKLDRAALPALADLHCPPAGRPARTPTERTLADLFAAVLDVRTVHLDDNFFALGGNSLSAYRLAHRVRTELGKDLSLSTFFAAPTVAELCRYLTADPVTVADPFGVLLALRTSGTRPPLFCLHPAGGLGWCYAGLPRHLGPDQPVYAIQARGLSGADEPPATSEEMIDDYVAQVRSVQRHGPYHLLGWSLGGALAHAVAVRLQQDGEEVALLAMLDSTPIPAQRHLPADIDASAVHHLLEEAAGHADPSATGTAGGRSDPPRAENAHPPTIELLTDEKIAAVTSVLANYAALHGTYTPSVFEGDLLSFDAAASGAAVSAGDQWRTWVTGTVESHPVAAAHRAMTQPGPLAHICDVLTQRLAPVMRR